MKLRYSKENNDIITPTYGSEGAAGIDLSAYIPDSVYSVEHICATRPSVKLFPNETKFINTGIKVEIPVGCVGLLFARSGLSCKQDLGLANAVGVIDSDFRGNIQVALHNHGTCVREIVNGQRIAQLVIVPYSKVELVSTDNVTQTDRGDGGFGSTGK